MGPTKRSVMPAVSRMGFGWLRRNGTELLRLVGLARRRFRILVAYRAFARSPKAAVRYLLYGRELDNFTYEISNTVELARFLGDALGVPPFVIAKYIDELQAATDLSEAIRRSLAGRRDRDATMPYGRRLGWYAVLRVVKPQLVVETGTHDGLGSAVLLEALSRNAREGTDGSLISFDIRDDTGWLVPDRLQARYHRWLGDAVDLLATAVGDRPIMVFIHDSDHRYEHETEELELALKLASPGAILMSDNAHASTAFRDFCDRHGMEFRFFREIPVDHFYPGAGIGLTMAGASPGGQPGSPDGHVEAAAGL